MSNPILALRDISKAYPGVMALDGVSLSFEQGEVHALVGENGAGKSTLIKVVSGAVVPDAGQIVLEGQTFPRMTPQQAIQLGVAVIYQEFNLFDSLTAAENIFIGERPSDKPLVDYREMDKQAVAIFERFGVSFDPGSEVKYLSPAFKQIVEISKAIHKQAKIIIMDEPTAPLSVSEVDKLFDIIRELKSRGITIIYVSHRLDEIFTIADRVSVLRDGKFVATLPTAETDREELIRLMVGRELSKSYPSASSAPGETLLEVVGLRSPAVHGASFSLKRGEILGVAGLVGSGRTELMRLIFGADRKEGGQIMVKGVPVRVKSPRQALAQGISLIPEDRKASGAFLNQSVGWNVCISILQKISSWLVINRHKEKELGQYYHQLLQIKTPGLSQKVLNLSGGNQQKVVLAKMLAANPEVLIFDEPTRGIDVGARAEIYQLMRDLAAEGKGIIMVSSDMEEVLGMSDRILVMAGGHIAGELDHHHFSQEGVLHLASGEYTRGEQVHEE